MPLDILFTKVVKVQTHSRWHSQASSGPDLRKHHVNFSRERVREAVEGERRLESHDPLSACPKPGDHKFFMVAGRKVDQPIDPSHGPLKTTGVEMMVQELRSKTSVSSLSGGKVAFLLERNREESVPIGGGDDGVVLIHARILS